MSGRISVSASVVAAVVVIVIVVAAVGLYFYTVSYRPSTTTPSTLTTSPTTTSTPTATSPGPTLLTGTLYVYIADPPANGTNVTPSAVYVTVSSIMAHSASGSWLTVSNRTVTVRLAQNLSFLASARLPAGNYTEVRLVVTNVTLTVNGANVTAELPSGVFKIPIVAGGLVIRPNGSAYLVLNMSPHVVKTGSGKYLMTPVVTAKAYYSLPIITTTSITTTAVQTTNTSTVTPQERLEITGVSVKVSSGEAAMTIYLFNPPGSLPTALSEALLEFLNGTIIASSSNITMYTTYGLLTITMTTIAPSETATANVTLSSPGLSSIPSGTPVEVVIVTPSSYLTVFTFTWP